MRANWGWFAVAFNGVGATIAFTLAIASLFMIGPSREAFVVTALGVGFLALAYSLFEYMKMQEDVEKARQHLLDAHTTLDQMHWRAEEQRWFLDAKDGDRVVWSVIFARMALGLPRTSGDDSKEEEE